MPDGTEITVANLIHEKGETVIAISKIKDWYLVCTKSRGALKGHPHCICGEDVVGWWGGGVSQQVTWLTMLVICRNLSDDPDDGS